MVTHVSSILLAIDIHSYWYVGSGLGRTLGGIDAATLKDEDGYPFLPGTHLKGLIRFAAEHLAKKGMNGWSADTIGIVFGEGKLITPSPQYQLAPCVLFGDARVKRSDVDMVEKLTSLVTRVSIDRFTASAKNVRLIEVGVPMTLYARLLWRPAERFNVCASEQQIQRNIAALATCWHERIGECLPLVTSIGSRRLGYGSATITIAEAKA